MMRRMSAAATAAGLLITGCQPCTASADPPPPAPDLSGYAQVPTEDYEFSMPDGSPYVSFRTPDGLICKIDYAAGCDGSLNGTAAVANEVELWSTPDSGGEVEPDGFSLTSHPQFVPPEGSSLNTLPEGHKIAFRDFQCAAGAGAVIMCVRDSPATGWFVLSPQHSGIGPPIAGLPDRFPDPHEFVLDYGPYPARPEFKNMFPVFTVASGLVCEIRIFSGGAVRCDGPLPGVQHGENEIFIDLSARPQQVGMRKTDPPEVPAYLPKNVRQMPIQHRLDYTYETFATCLATGDGGVACYVQTPDQLRGFVVSSDSAWTFGG
jgi:hypothetical protein